MNIWADCVTAFLAAVGLAALLGGAAKVFVRPRPAPSVTALLCAAGDGGALAEQLRGLTGLAEYGNIGRILVVDCGLTDRGRQLCRLLAQREARLLLCSREELACHLPPFTT